jgi:hypothetical protein
MLELGSSGSVRGVSSNGHPYRDPRPVAAMHRSVHEHRNIGNFRVGGATKTQSSVTGRNSPLSELVRFGLWHVCGKFHPARRSWIVLIRDSIGD